MAKSKTKKQEIAGRDHDWISLKAKYLTSEIQTVTAFLIEEGIIRDSSGLSGSVSDAVKGWREEKDNLKREVLEDVKAEYQSRFKITMQELEDYKWLTINQLVALLKSSKDSRELERIWKIVKTELGEPTSVTKNENLNQNVTLDDLLSKLDGAE